MKLQPSLCLTAAFLVLAAAGSPCLAGPPGQQAAADPTGTWKWAPTNPDGRTVEITFTLKLHGETLMGTITQSSSTTPITNGVVKGDKITFQTIREDKGAKALTRTTYIGKLSGDWITGKVLIDAGGKARSDVWEAKRVKE